MRLWLSGPRLFNGLVRPGISLGKEDFRPTHKARAMVAEATLGLFRRPDGAILMAIAHMNGDADTMPDMTPVAVFAFASVPASVEVREGARVRLAKHIGPDGLVAGLSVGQVVAAIKAEMAALDVEGKFILHALSGWLTFWPLALGVPGFVRRREIFVIRCEHASVFLEGLAHAGQPFLWRRHPFTLPEFQSTSC